LFERAETRRQQQNRKSKCEQKPDADAAIDDNADRCIAPLVTEVGEKPHPDAITGDDGHYLTEKLSDHCCNAHPDESQLPAVHSQGLSNLKPTHAKKRNLQNQQADRQ
jgi:hypothetical protein